jgi:hypothetical protein
VIHLACPHCRAALKTENDRIGKVIRCPTCKSPMLVPRSQGEIIPATRVAPEKPSVAPARPKDRSKPPPRVSSSDSEDSYTQSRTGPMFVALGVVGCIAAALIIVLVIGISRDKRSQQANREQLTRPTPSTPEPRRDEEPEGVTAKRSQTEPFRQSPPSPQPPDPNYAPRPPQDLDPWGASPRPQSLQPPPVPSPTPAIESAGLDGLRLEIYGGMTRAEWDRLKDEERRAVLLERLAPKETAARQELEAANRNYRQRLESMQLPTQATALAAELRAQLLPAGADKITGNLNVRGRAGHLPYVDLYLYNHGADTRAIDAASQALSEGTKAQERALKIYQEIRLLVQELQEAIGKYATTMAKSEMERRRICKKYPQPDDPEYVLRNGLLVTDAELRTIRSFEKAHSTPRGASDDYLLSLDPKTVAKLRYIGSYSHPSRDDVAAVCYAGGALEYNRFLYIHRTGEGLWFVYPRLNRANHLFTGSPPVAFRRIEDWGVKESSLERREGS